MRIRVVGTLLAAAAWLAGCGGGAADMQAPPRQLHAAQAVVDSALCRPGGDSAAYTQVDGQCLRSADLLRRAAIRPRALQSSSAAGLDADALFNWAELTFPSLFPGHKATTVSGGWTQRYYPEGQLYLSVQAGNAYALGPLTGGALVFLGRVSDFQCAVYAYSCDGTPYAAVQPPAVPERELVTLNQVSGTVNLAPDTLDAAGRQGGVLVELHEVQASGLLGATVASTRTAADGTFALAMPAGASTADGEWLLQAQAAAGTLRAYVYPGAVRVDISSEAWVRRVSATLGRLALFRGPGLDKLKGVCRSLGLVADVRGAGFTGQPLDSAPDSLLASLQADPALLYLTTTLKASGALPADGVGDVGSFLGLAAPSVNQYLRSDGSPALLETLPTFTNGPYWTPPANGQWQMTVRPSHKAANGEWSRDGESSLQAWLQADKYQTALPSSSSVVGNRLASLVGYATQYSLPLRPGARQVDARRFTNSGLNFTGGADQQPFTFSAIERVGAVETIATAAGMVRAVPVVSELEIAFPNAAGGASRSTTRIAVWLIPGVGMVKEVDQALLDGGPIAGSPDISYQLTQGYANGQTWPAGVSFKPNYFSTVGYAATCRLAFPDLRRVITSDAVAYGFSRLSVWDMDTGKQLGGTPTLIGNFAVCPVSAGPAGPLWVAISAIAVDADVPLTLAAATQQSDVVRVLDARDLSDVASYRLPPVPHAKQPALYSPAYTRTLSPAPDGSGRFLAVATDTYGLNWGGINNTFVQMMGPGLAKPWSAQPKQVVHFTDWATNRLFTRMYTVPQDLLAADFDNAGLRNVRTIRNSYSTYATPWYASANYLHYGDGTSVSIANGANGPTLALALTLPAPNETVRGYCGQGYGVVICMDWKNDQLVRYDADTWQRTGVAPLGSELRSRLWTVMSAQTPDLRHAYPTALGLLLLDANTVVTGQFEVRVARWN